MIESRFVRDIVTIALVSILLLSSCLAATPKSPTAPQALLQQQTAVAQPTTIEGMVAEIVKARSYTSQMVVLASKNFSAGSDKYNRAFTLYAGAYSGYSAWAAYLTAALRAGHAKHLNNNPEYNQVASTASASGTEFTNYVITNTPGAGESHAIITVLSSLADLGIKLWSNISKQITTQRNNSALSFCESTKWQTWQEITDPQATKQAGDDYCKLPSSSNSDSTKNSTQNSPDSKSTQKKSTTPNQPSGRTQQ